MHSTISRSGGPELVKETGLWTETTYQFLVFVPCCETYAIRFAGSEVTGVCGPLEYDEVLFKSLPNFPYECQLERIAWVTAHFSDFLPCDTECEEGMVRI